MGVGGDGWVSMDRRLFRRLWRLGGFGAVVFGTLLSLELEGSREGILYDEICIVIIEKELSILLCRDILINVGTVTDYEHYL